MNAYQKIIISFIIALFFFFLLIDIGKGETIEREAKSTLTPIEMNVGDTLKFTLQNGQVRTLILEETDSEVMITNLKDLGVYHREGGTLYRFFSKIKIDGHPMTMERYVGSQESFYEPYVVNGMRIWFDGVSDIFDNGIVTETHGECKPHKDARFAITDMTDRISPDIIYSFYDNKEHFIPVNQAYNGYDVWMGAYFGHEAHGGLDINMPAGSPNYTPIALDDHYYFNSLADGDNNNRWRGIRKWENGDKWIIQNHHIINLLIPEHTPINAGVYYAEAAGVNADNVQHSHFIFRVKTPRNDEEIFLDPWILFWQSFEDSKRESGEIKAVVAPFSPGNVGEPVSFKGGDSILGVTNKKLSYYWTFGDGGWSDKINPIYTYSKPGIYPVTLVVDNGARKASFTQHITIDGEKTKHPAFILSSPDEPSFRTRPIQMMDTYGVPLRNIPHTLPFVARESRPKPDTKFVELHQIGNDAEQLSQIEEIQIIYLQGDGWLQVNQEGKGNEQQLLVSVDATDMPTGMYRAKVEVTSPGSINETQSFLVEMNVPTHPPNHWREKGRQVINQNDIRYNRFYRTPYFWVRPQFGFWQEKGFNNDFYFTNGGRDKKGEFARFNPDIEVGTYRVSFSEKTPFEPARRAITNDDKKKLINPEFNPDSRFAVIVKSKSGKEKIWIEPSKSRIIGTFEFEEGMDGYIDVLAEGSNGQVLVDAIIFEKIK